MATLIIFVVGYMVGSISALLIVGLTLASRRVRGEPTTMELQYDVEHSRI